MHGMKWSGPIDFWRATDRRHPTPQRTHHKTRNVRLSFILMTPQLYINYRLKSVSHLPWRFLCFRCACPRVCVCACLPVCVHIFQQPARRHSTLTPSNTHVQIRQHLHRRPLRLHNQDAHHAPHLLLPRRRGVLGLFIPKVHGTISCLSV